MRHDHSIATLCGLFGVSPSGFYDWDRRRASSGPRAVADVALAGQIAAITYLSTAEGWLYRAGVMDLHSRRIVGWAMSPTIDSALVLSALSMAALHRSRPPGLVFHSDRGVHYAAANFRAALTAAGLTASMSRRGNRYDNDAMESFWSTLKLELVYRQEFQTHQKARVMISGFIEDFYNRHRRHTSLGGLSPAIFETKNN